MTSEPQRRRSEASIPTSGSRPALPDGHCGPAGGVLPAAPGRLSITAGRVRAASRPHLSEKHGQNVS